MRPYDRIRVAVACDGGRLAAWESAAIGTLRERCGAEIIAIIETPDRLGSAAGPLEWVARRSSAAVARTRPAAGALGSAGTAGTSDNIDLIVDFSREGIAPGMAAALGVWRFEFAGGASSAVEACLIALSRGSTIVEAALVCERDGRRTVLRNGALGAFVHSIGRTLDAVLGELSAWPAIAVGGFDRPEGQTATVALKRDRYTKPANTSDTNASLVAAAALFRVAAQKLARFPNLFFDPCWNIGIAQVPIGSLLRRDALPRVDWFPHLPSSIYLADPWGIPDGDDGAIVLCESYDYASRRGSICWTRFDGRSWSKLEPAMALPGHASYPTLVEDGGVIYCVPETQDAAEVALYRAVRFPDRWEKEAVLLPGFHGVDSTVIRHAGRWWLFCTDARDRSMQNLQIFHADRLQGPWLAHARNPVKVDVRSARPAGSPFVEDGVLYRPAQDCSGSYGGRVTINRVLALTPDDFAEETASVVGPERRSRYSDGFHTLTRLGTRVLVDGRGRALTFGGLRERMARLFARAGKAARA